MIFNKPFFINPNSNARRQIERWHTSRPKDAALIGKIASQPEAIWLVDETMDEFVEARPAIEARGTLPILVAYNIPNRDLGQYSAGGARNVARYKIWIDRLNQLLRHLECVVVLSRMRYPISTGSVTQTPPSGSRP
jgi:endoglucanase